VRWKALFDVIGRLSNQTTDEKPSSWAGMLFADFETAYRASMTACGDMKWRLNRIMREAGKEREIQTRLAEQSDGWMLYIRVTPGGWAQRERDLKRQAEKEARMDRKSVGKRKASHEELVAAFGLAEEILVVESEYGA